MSSECATFEDEQPGLKMPSKSTPQLNSIRAATTQLVIEYCSNSTIHGISYIGGSNHQRSRWERFWWLLMVLLSLAGCGTLIGNVYAKWQNNPVMLSFDQQLKSVQQIPFPAVTVCPEIKYRPDVVEFTEKVLKGDIDQEEAERVYVAAMQYSCELATNITEILDGMNWDFKKDIVDVIKEIYLGPPEELINYCEFKFDCTQYFRETLTDEGICYTFNLLPDREIFRRKTFLSSDSDWTSQTSSWTIDGGYQSTNRYQNYPHTASLGSGYKAGMDLELRVPLSFIKQLCRQTEGFFMTLHSPAEYPLMVNNYVYLKYNHDMMITIRPDIITTSPELWSYSPQKRQCFFSHERPLRYFISYTQANCEMECYANYTRDHCGCVRFFMPRDEGIPVCDISNIHGNCYDHVVYLNRSGIQERCGCLPGCNSIEYNTEFVQTIYNPEESKRDLERYKFSSVKMYFNQNQYMGLKRNELFGWTDFIANCGGVLGLCMGVSLISLAELLYYCLIRPVLAVVECRRHRRSSKAVHILKVVRVE